MAIVVRYLGLIALAVGVVIATLSFSQPTIEQMAFDQRAQEAASRGQQAYVEFNTETPEQKQADRLDGMIYGFGLSLLGVIVFASTTRPWPSPAPVPQAQTPEAQAPASATTEAQVPGAAQPAA